MQILFVVVVFLCKIAACLLIHRLICHKFQRIYALAIVTASVVCCFISLVLVNVGLGSHQPWVHQQNEAETLVSLRSDDPGQNDNDNTACARYVGGLHTLLSPTSSTDA